jgi:hypothetical protein
VCAPHACAHSLHHVYASDTDDAFSNQGYLLMLHKYHYQHLLVYITQLPVFKPRPATPPPSSCPPSLSRPHHGNLHPAVHRHHLLHSRPVRRRRRYLSPRHFLSLTAHPVAFLPSYRKIGSRRYLPSPSVIAPFRRRLRPYPAQPTAAFIPASKSVSALLVALDLLSDEAGNRLLPFQS